jgi:hypothetical protein
MAVFCEFINDYQNAVKVASLGETFDEVHADDAPGIGWYRQWV